MRVEKARLLELLHAENEQIEGALPAYQRQATALQATLDDASLNGKSYDTLRERIQKAHAPRARVQLASLKALADGNGRNADAVSTLPETSPGVADTAEAQQRIDELERMNADLQSQLEAAQGTDTENVIASPCQRAMGANASMIAALHDAIAQIEAYAAASAGFYQDAQDEVEGLSQVGIGTYHMAEQSEMLVDDAYVEQRLGVSKQDFVKMQMEQYGFDEETAETMWEIYKALYRKYPKASQEQIDWMWLRIMSQPDYNGFSWRNVCGNPIGADGQRFYEDYNADDNEYVIKYLGIDAEAWAKLKFAIAMQHFVSSNYGKKKLTDLDDPDRKRIEQLYKEAYGKDDFENRFGDYIQRYGDDANNGHAYADFSHQCVTAATMYRDDMQADMGFSEGADERKAFAGWMGDCVLVSEKGHTTLGPDDYKADLDADSISRRARGEGKSYQQAAKEYYGDIASGATNRADEFTGNHGGYDNVVNQVFMTLAYPDDLATLFKEQVVLRVETNPYSDSSRMQQLESLGTEEKEQKIGEDYQVRDTKVFLDGLKNHQNEIPREPEQ